MDPGVVLLIVAADIAIAVLRSSNRAAQARAQAAEALRGVTSVAEEDVTRLGEDVARLDTDTAGHDLDEAARQDYRRALDAYDAAKSALNRVTKSEDIRQVTGILEDGRFALASLRARVACEPLPARRPPCFFNPQPGPSSEDVDWAPPGGVPRSVPACAADAERVHAGAEPDVRKVAVGAGRRPYCSAPSCSAGSAAGTVMGPTRRTTRTGAPTPATGPRMRVVRVPTEAAVSEATAGTTRVAVSTMAPSMGASNSASLLAGMNCPPEAKSLVRGLADEHWRGRDQRLVGPCAAAVQQPADGLAPAAQRRVPVVRRPDHP
jgi:hypothetical protein